MQTTMEEIRSLVKVLEELVQPLLEGGCGGGHLRIKQTPSLSVTGGEQDLRTRLPYPLYRRQ